MKPGDLFIEKYRMGELDSREIEMLKKRYPDNDELNQIIEELDADDRLILENYTPEAMASRIRERAEEDEAPEGGRSFSRFRLARFTALAAAAALVLVFGIAFFRLPPTTSGNLVAASDSISSERIKGLEPSLKIYRHTGDSAEILENRDVVSEKDLLQIEYISGSFRYGVIFSIDGRGTVTMHHPTYEGISAELDQGGAVLLPYAYELDDAPDFERFFFVAGGSVFNLDDVMDAAYELAAKGRASRREFLELPDSYYQTTILLRKGDQR